MLSLFTRIVFLAVLQPDHVLCNLKTIKLNYLCLECSSSFLLNFPVKYQHLKMSEHHLNSPDVLSIQLVCIPPTLSLPSEQSHVFFVL